mmetsp:Transcript_32206/g.53220  ORF Transcript_32206/g.53220 Transcript_32206/m.53220 type:complete len:155 (+) Transcript_32206:37-501(+)|eukprot:CAMPEP_0119308948 /NCGR_PEP_ID=MMETSP1333-20130426/13073_1 /TAXON_ID=418940 /ORGANISM="Scyphosphaera apsteinii, Strain RCC1455" /LENGTH=154 /DNA_ID=CAMNT_0007312833 /DNA_START=29 /DNA_END=493 /DNA_ORIENTATION=+
MALFTLNSLLLMLLCGTQSSALKAQSFAPPHRPATVRRRFDSSSGLSMAVSKSDLVEAIASRAGVSKKMAGTVLSAALDVIVESVADGDKVSLIGFGTFHSKERKARNGRNPKTSEPMHIPASMVPTFSFGKGFKDAVRQQYLDSTADSVEGPS